MDIGQKYFERGQTLYELKRYKDALGEFVKALTYYPDDEQVINAIVQVYIKLKDFDNALLYLERFFEINPLNARPFYIKSFILNAQDKYEESEYYIKEAIRLNPNYVSNWTTYALICLALERYEEALKYVENGLSINPNDKECLIAKMNILFTLERTKESFELANLLQSIYPNDSHVLMKIGILNFNFKNIEYSKSFFIESLRINPSNEYSKDMLNEIELIFKKQKRIKYISRTIVGTIYIVLNSLIIYYLFSQI